MRPQLSLAIVLLLASAGSSTLAQESRPVAPPPPQTAPSDEAEELNPIYRNWSQFKPGSFAKLRTSTDAGGRRTVSTVTFTLKEVTAEKVLVEQLTVVTADGKETRMPAELVEHLARFRSPDADKPLAPAAGKTSEGNETVELAGKRWRAHWKLSEVERGELRMTTKTWTSDDVPGMTLKSHNDTSGIIRVIADTVLIDAKAERK